MSRLLAICLLLCGAAIAQATETSSSASRDDLNAFKELQQSKLESLKELQAKDVEAVRQQITAVDKRVDDQLAQLGQSIDRFGILATVLSVGITVLLVLGGFLGYRNAKSEAKEAASDAAEASAKDWIDKETTQLRKQIEAIAQRAAQVHTEMDEHAQEVKAYAADVKKAIDTVQESIGTTGSQTQTDLDESTKVLAQRVRELKASNEDSYSFDDWNTRAHAAYTAGALEDAAYFWLKAASVPNAGVASVAKVLINRGIAQGQLDQNEAAIATNDEVVHRFGEAAEPVLREQVVKALINKGISQGKLNQNVAAMATYDEVVHRFGEAAEPALREQVVKALINKGLIQGKLNQNVAAIATYDEVVRRFGETAEPALRQYIARALNSAAFGRLVQAKRLLQLGDNPEAQELLKTALNNLDDALKRCEQSNGMILGNRAYVLCLLGNYAAAEDDFAAALRASVHGGKKLYDDTLKDLEINPLAEDAHMRALVERAWATFQQRPEGPIPNS